MAAFGIVVVFPCVVTLGYMISKGGLLSVKPADILVHLLPILVFFTAVSIMWRRYRETPQKQKMERQKIGRYDSIIILSTGYLIPLVANGFGSQFHGKPMFYGVGVNGVLFAALLNLVPIGTAWFLYRDSQRFGNILKYLPIICGYGGLACFYFVFNIAEDAQAGLALIFAPIMSIFLFIGGYFLAMLIHSMTKRQGSARK